MNRYVVYLKQKLGKILMKPVLLVRYFKDYFLLQGLLKKENRGFTMSFRNLYPCLNDNTDSMGFDFNYVYHPAWAARIISHLKPEFHVDVSSTLYFPTIVSAFIPVKYYEFRKLDMNLDNLTTQQTDLLSLPFKDNSIHSISCMHTIEHIGLGRYGDPIDPNADIKAINELKRVLAPGGSLLFVSPIGKPRIFFNAHRVYAYRQIMDYFSDLTLQEFTLIPKGGKLIYHASEDLANKEDYGCGCFWFIKNK